MCALLMDLGNKICATLIYEMLDLHVQHGITLLKIALTLNLSKVQLQVREELQHPLLIRA
jgi:hypothetical protein